MTRGVEIQGIMIICMFIDFFDGDWLLASITRPCGGWRRKVFHGALFGLRRTGSGRIEEAVDGMVGHRCIRGQACRINRQDSTWKHVR